MFNKTTKIYITGASGLVGRNISENNLISSCELLMPRHSDLDLLNFDALNNFIKDNKPDWIIHTAGLVGGIQANIDNPYSFLLENALMGINLVKAARENKIKNFINLSSSCTYPATIQNPLKEEKILTGSFEPTNEAYAIAKTAILKLCEYVSKEDSYYRYKTLIPCNLYGKYDNFSLKTSHLIPAIINKVHNAKINNLNEIEIWSDGNARREFMFATDFAQIIPEIMKNFDKVDNIINIGLGKDYTINEYYQIISKIIGYKGGFVHDLSKPSGMKQKLLDITKQKALNIKSKFSLEEGIQETYRYYLETME